MRLAGANGESASALKGPELDGQCFAKVQQVNLRGSKKRRFRLETTQVTSLRRLCQRRSPCLANRAFDYRHVTNDETHFLMRGLVGLRL